MRKLLAVYMAVYMAAVVAFAAPVLADEINIKFDPARAEICARNADSHEATRACAGVAAGACMEATLGGMTTYGMHLCLSAEFDWWDAKLNTVYAAAVRAAKAADEEQEQTGLTAASEAEALREMQRAWITYRDARCEYSAAQWAGGTGAGPDFVDCMVLTTVEQLLVLQGVRT